jgi:hypothetical protein
MTVANLQRKESGRSPVSRPRGASSIRCRIWPCSKLLGRVGRGRYTTHGRRTSFPTWAAEEADFPRDVVEAVLPHVGQRTEVAHQRGTMFGKRRNLMQIWGACCDVGDIP